MERLQVCISKQRHSPLQGLSRGASDAFPQNDTWRLWAKFPEEQVLLSWVGLVFPRLLLLAKQTLSPVAS